MAENERIIELSINEKQFKNQMSAIISYMDTFENRINNFEKKVNKINFSKNFSNIDKNMKKSSQLINKDINSINSNLNTISNSINGSIIDSLTKLNDKFSFLGVTSLKVINSLSDSFLGLSKNIVKSMTDIDNMTAALGKYEQKNIAIRTIMNSITDDKVPEAYKDKIDGTVKTIDYVTDALSKLETFSDETSYEFTQMTTSIGKLVSMGNSLEQASDTVLGMANWSSLVGKSAKDFESLSYAIEKVAGLGYVGLQQYQMLSTYMDPQTKKNILEEAAALGNLQKVSDDVYKTLSGESVSLESFSTNLKERWLTMDVLNGVMSKYSSFSNAVIEYMDKTGATASEAIKRLEKDYDSVSVKAFKSAQEAKTFGEAIESVRVAVTTGWAKSFEYIFGNVEEASEIFTSLANQLYNIFAIGKYTRNALLEEWSNLGGRETLFSSLLGDVEEVDGVKERVGGLLSYISDTINAIKEPINEVFGLLGDDADDSSIKEYAKSIIDLTNRFKNFISTLKPTDEFLKNLSDVVYNISFLVKASSNAIISSIKNVLDFIKPISKQVQKIGVLINKLIYNVILRLGPRIIDLKNNIGKLASPILQLILKFIIDITKYLHTFISLFSNIITYIDKFIDKFNSILISFNGSNAYNNIINNFEKILNYIKSLAVNIPYYFAKILKGDFSLDGFIKDLDVFSKDLLSKLNNVFGNINKNINNILTKNNFNGIDFSKYINGFKNLISSISTKMNSALNTDGANGLITLIVSKIKSVFNFVKQGVLSVINTLGLKDLYESIKNGIIKIIEKYNIEDVFNNITEKISKAFNKISESFSKIFGSPEKLLDDTTKGAITLKEKLLNIFKSIGSMFSGVKNSFSELSKNLNFTGLLPTIFNGFKVFISFLINTVGELVKIILDNNALKLIASAFIIFKLTNIIKNILTPINEMNAIKMKKANNQKILYSILGVLAIVGGLYLLSIIPVENLKKAIISMTIILSVVIALNSINNLISKKIDDIGKKNNSKKGKGQQSPFSGLLLIISIVLMFAISVKLITNQIVKYPIQSIFAIVAILGSIYLASIAIEKAMSKISNKKGGNKQDKGLMSLITMFRNLLASVNILISFTSQLNFGQILSLIGAAVIGVLALGGAIALLKIALNKLNANFISGNQDTKSSKGFEKLFGQFSVTNLVALKLVIDALSSSIREMASIPFDKLAFGTASLVALIVTVGLMSSRLKLAAPSLTMIIALIGAFAISIKLLNDSRDGLINFSIGLAALTASIYLIFGAFKLFHTSAATFQKIMLTLSITIGVITASIMLLNNSRDGLINFGVALASATASIYLIFSAFKLFNTTAATFQKITSSLSILFISLSASVLILSLAIENINKASGDTLKGFAIIALGLTLVGIAIAFVRSMLGIPPTGGATTTIFNGLTEGGSKIGEFFSNLGSNITEFFSGLPDKIKEVGSKISEFFSKLPDFIKDIGPKIGEFFSNLPNMLKDVGIKFIEGISNIGPKIIEFFTNIGPKIMETFTNFGGFIKEGLINGVKNIPEAIGELFHKIIESFATMFGIHSPSTVFFDFGKNLVLGLFGGVSGDIGSISDIFSNLLGTITNDFVNFNILKDILDISDFKEFIDSIKNLFNMKLIDFSTFEEFKTNMANIFNDIISILTPIVDAIKNTFFSIIDAIKEIGLAIGSILAVAIITPINTIKKVIGGVLSIFTGLFNSISNGMKGSIKPFSVIGKFIEAIFNHIKNVISVISSLIQIVVNVIRIIVEIIKTVFITIRLIWSAIFVAINYIVTGIINFIKGIISGIGELLSKIFPKNENGENIFTKIFNTLKKVYDFVITNGIVKLFSKIAGFVKGAADKLHEFNDKYSQFASTGDISVFNVNNLEEADALLEEIDDKLKYAEDSDDPLVDREALEKAKKALEKEKEELLKKEKETQDKIQKELEKTRKKLEKGQIDLITAYKDLYKKIGKEESNKFLKEELDKLNVPERVKKQIIIDLETEVEESNKTEVEKKIEETTKKLKEEDEKKLKAHRSYLSNYKEDLETEKRLVKMYADDQKKLFEKNMKDKVEGYTQELMNQTNFNDLSQNAWDTYLSQLADQFEAEDELFKEKIDNLDENMSQEEKMHARNLEALKKFNEEKEVSNSGMNWGSASVTKKYEQKSSEIKPHEAKKNLQSYLDAYKVFQEDIKKMAGTKISDQFLSALYKDGPNGELFLAAKTMGDNQLEELGSTWDEIHGYDTKGDSIFLTNLLLNRKNIQANHVRNDHEVGSIDNPYVIDNKKYIMQGAVDIEMLKRTKDEDKREEIIQQIAQNDEEYADYLRDELAENEIVEDDTFGGPGSVQNAYTGAYNQVTAIGEGIQAALPTLQQSTQLLNQNMAQLSATQNQETGSNQNTEILTQVGELQNKMSTAEAAIQQIINSILQTVQGLINTDSGSVFEQEGLQVNQGLANGIIKNIGVVTDSVIQMCNAAIQAARENLGIASPSTVFYKLGEYIIQGLCNAITDGQSAVTSAMVDEVLASLESESEKSEGIASPSKKWYKFGSFIDQGLANGISENVQAPMSALGSLISDISENMEMDEEYNPVITPVIDLSEAKKQSKGINTLFANNQAMQISADLQANRLSQNEGKNSENNNGVKTITFTQNNYSPKELSRLEIYRQTNNQFSQLKTLLDK